MFSKMTLIIIVILECWIGFTLAGTYSAVATFNDYGTQQTTACHLPPTNSQGSNIYAAALGDLSPLWSGERCEGRFDGSKCTGTGTCKDCQGPPCPSMQSCGKCFYVSCAGPLNSQTGTGACTQNRVKVMIVDACPATHPANYCKTSRFGGSIPDTGACTAAGTNAFDLATPVKAMLSTYAGGINLKVEGPISC